ncbi:RNA-guided endonuclease InsQ/TnpB family protein [Methanobrevibacter sp.]|uniref:RNA-guided endonuclease InsQ/TnpB family protein n=1 Tax=Methanobrevibacter sp. TaxID=66852 RepID=UPI00388F3517
MKVVNKYLNVRIYPAKVDKNDNGEKIVTINEIESNIGIYRFIYNKELEFINHFRQLLIQNGYQDKFIVNDTSCNIILNMLMQEYPFLRKAESSSRQQSFRDLKNAFKRYKNPNLKSNYPVFKSKKNKNDTFRIMKTNNNLRIQKDKNAFYKILIPKFGLIKFKTSKKYRQMLIQASDPNDPTATIKHITIKKTNNKYYAIFNIKTIHIPQREYGPLMQVGIDIGCSKLAVLSNTQEIPNLDLTKETDKIIKYQRKMKQHQQKSIRYQQAKRLYHKWMDKLVNKRNDYYDKQTLYIAKNSCFVAVQNENIKAWKTNKYLSHNLQLNAPRIFMDKLEYKCHWNDVEFIKVPMDFPSTQICSNCSKKNPHISGLGNLQIRDWDCPECGKHHDRDVNASKNILQKGLQTVGTTVQ